MRWERIDPTSRELEAWSFSGACPFCGDRSSASGCVCRYCDSCSSYWTTDTRVTGDDGEPHREDCPECVAANAESETTETDKRLIREYESREARKRGETGFDTLEEWRGEK